MLATSEIPETLDAINVARGLCKLEVFKGVFGSHLNYIRYIALLNCSDYFEILKKKKEEMKINTPDKFQRLRFFLNAIESLNNIPDYFFHEYKVDKVWNDKNDESKIIGIIRKNFPILKDIEQIANAYKHCIRKNKKNLKASDLQSIIFKIKIESKNINIDFNYDSIESEDILGEAFRFWVNYSNNPNIEYLLEGN